MDTIAIHEELEEGLPAKNNISLYQDIKDQKPAWKLLLSGPFIWGMIVPLVFLDITIEIYQQVAFRLYGINLLNRKEYIIIDRHHLSKLTSVEKLNCMYCGYANGLLPYARDVALETEKYWCAVKHEKNMADVQPQQKEFFEREDFS